MSGKRYKNEQFLNAQSLDASFNSDAILFDKCPEISIQLSFSGSSPTGSFKLQASDDITYDASSVSTWTDISGSSQAITTDGNHQWKLLARYKWIRVVYTRTSGTGTVNGTFFAVEEP